MLIKEFHALALELIRGFSRLKLIHNLLQRLLKLLRIDRFQYIIHNPQPYRSLCIVKFIAATEYHASHFLLLIYHIVNEFYTVHERHLHICEKDIIILLTYLLQCIKTVYRLVDIKFHIQLFQKESYPISLYSLVINDQYSIHLSTAFLFLDVN